MKYCSSCNTENKPEASYEELFVQARLDFAKQCFINAQELNRLMDQKAGFLLAAIGLLTSACAILASIALGPSSQLSPPATDWYFGLKVTAEAVLVVYVALAFAATYTVSKVFQALSYKQCQTDLVHGLIFPLMVLEILKGFPAEGPTREAEYCSRLTQVGPTEIVRNYACQILEISRIYESKHHQINRSVTFFCWLASTWLVAVLLLLALVILR